MVNYSGITSIVDVLPTTRWNLSLVINVKEVRPTGQRTSLRKIQMPTQPFQIANFSIKT
jgi:hypothetical protein